MLCIVPWVSFASSTDGIIDSDSAHHYAWSENYGWFNFFANQGDIHVTDSVLTGNIWNTNIGWINLSPNNSGVRNDGEGNLSGSAWNTNIGWVNFSGITIDSNGLFHGFLTVTNAGRITFDCDHCSVKTDWRPASVRNVVQQNNVQANTGVRNSGNILANQTTSQTNSTDTSPASTPETSTPPSVMAQEIIPAGDISFNAPTATESIKNNAPVAGNITSGITEVSDQAPSLFDVTAEPVLQIKKQYSFSPITISVLAGLLLALLALLAIKKFSNFK